ncbi:phage portal protein [Orenia marismortui]|uniref:HK97 family phage portal protein n=1 Tax=Orenia marismortui TaxID=46469 RepID=A0A4R8GZG6_9FIRM|nr:phage portal protein [Orenia marismortui]TDX52147.1 HK97 family phage portal protein [Orenia marismortui]
MAVWDWFLGLFNKDNGQLELDAYVGEIAGEVFFKELAVQACINLIANAVSRSEFQTFENGKEVKKNNYYLFNVEPNPNKSASKFWRDAVAKLVRNNECLVIQQGYDFYVADDFAVEKFAFKDYIYHDIVIDNYQLRNSYIQPDVFHFELHNDKIQNVIEGLNRSYSKLIEVSQKNYKKNNSRKMSVNVPTNYPQTDKAQSDLKELFEKKFKKFFEAEGEAVIPFTNGIGAEEFSSNIGVKGGADNKEIRSFINDIFDFVAIAFQIPPQLIKGEIADIEKLIDYFLTFCVNPIAELITDEINRKLYGRRDYLNRTYMKLNTSMIKAVNIKDIAGSLEILLRIGAYTVDDCLKSLGMEPLETDWSTKRFMTKNYEEIEKRIRGDD